MPLAPAPPEWPDFLRLYISAFRFFSSPWRFLTAIYIAMLSASWVERRLVYSATCYVSVILAIVRLVTAAQSSAVASARLENATDISVTLFADPV